MKKKLSLSTCWNSHRHEDGYAMLQEIRDLGFESVELSHAIRYSLWPGILRAVEEKIIHISSLHNFCPVPMGVLHPSPNCYLFSDHRSPLRDAAVQATKETIEQAAKLGAKVVVLHLGWAGPAHLTRSLEALYQKKGPYHRSFLQKKIKAVRQRQLLFPEVWDRVKSCLDLLVPFAQKRGVQLGFENRERYEEFPDEEEMQIVLENFPEETVGYWHDFGHAARKDFLRFHTHEATLEKRKLRCIGCHIHDSLPPDQDHLALGKGVISFAPLVQLLSPGILPVLELNPKVSSNEVQESHQLWDTYINT